MSDFLLEMTDIFKALSDPTRLKVMRLVATKDKLFVAEIAKKLGITTSAASQHLKVLKNVKVVEPVREGYKVFYKINTDTIDSFYEKMNTLREIAFVPCNFDSNCEECSKMNECKIN